MNPREIVFANLDHGSPKRIGLDFTDGRISDICWGGMGPSKTFTERRWTEGNVEYYDDEWGNVWRRVVGGSVKGEVHEPAIRDWRDLDKLVLPDYGDPDRYAAVRRQFASTDTFRLAGLPGWVFATSRYLRKMEVYFADLIEYRNEVDEMHQMVVAAIEQAIRRFAEAGADGVIFAEDLGVQDRLLISPTMWRDVFRTHYLRLTGVARQCGLRVFMHSCGFNWDLLDDLAEAGIDCFQFDQPAAYDMPALAAKLKRLKVALHSPVDIQKVLPTGDRALIEAEARRMVELFGGFFIAKNYGDLSGIGVRPEWDRWAYETFAECADLPKR